MAWVTPEEFFGPDINQDMVFAAVGRALCAWETMEYQFGVLYTIVNGQRAADGTWIETGAGISEYGLIKSFDTRLDRLSDAAERFFAVFPSQPNEGELDRLITAARPLALKRHQIAHSVLVRDSRPDDKFIPGMVRWPDRYAIAAPWHAARSLTKRDKPPVPPGTPEWAYTYRISEIDAFADQFRKIAVDVDALVRTITPQ